MTAYLDWVGGMTYCEGGMCIMEKIRRTVKDGIHASDEACVNKHIVAVTGLH